MNIRQLHDAIRQPGAKHIGYDNTVILHQDRDGLLFAASRKPFAIPADALERDDWFVRKPKATKP